MRNDYAIKRVDYRHPRTRTFRFRVVIGQRAGEATIEHHHAATAKRLLQEITEGWAMFPVYIQRIRPKKTK